MDQLLLFHLIKELAFDAFEILQVRRLSAQECEQSLVDVLDFRSSDLLRNRPHVRRRGRLRRHFGHAVELFAEQRRPIRIDCWSRARVAIIRLVLHHVVQMWRCQLGNHRGLLRHRHLALGELVVVVDLGQYFVASLLQVGDLQGGRRRGLYVAHLSLAHDDTTDEGIVTRLLFWLVHETALDGNLHFLRTASLLFHTIGGPLRSIFVLLLQLVLVLHFSIIIAIILIITDALLGTEQGAVPIVLIAARFDLEIVLLEDRLPLALILAAAAKASASR